MGCCSTDRFMTVYFGLNSQVSQELIYSLNNGVVPFP